MSTLLFRRWKESVLITFSAQIFSRNSANGAGLKYFRDFKAWLCTEFNNIPSESETEAYRIERNNESGSGTRLEKLISTSTEENGICGSVWASGFQPEVMSGDFPGHAVHKMDPRPTLDGPSCEGQQGHGCETLVETKNHKLKSYRARPITETRASAWGEGCGWRGRTGPASKGKAAPQLPPTKTTEDQASSLPELSIFQEKPEIWVPWFPLNTDNELIFKQQRPPC